MKQLTLTTAALLSSLVCVAASSSSANAEVVAPKAEIAQEDLNEVNGQLVPVGDAIQYNRRAKRFFVGANPIAWMMGIYGAQASVAVHHLVALRGDVTLYHEPVEFQDSGIEFTGSAAIFFRNMYNGIYLEPGLMYREMSDDRYDYNGNEWVEGKEKTLGLQSLLGYQRTWDSGLSASAAFGAGRKLMSREVYEGETYREREGEVYVNGYLRLGYNF